MRTRLPAFLLCFTLLGGVIGPAAAQTGPPDPSAPRTDPQSLVRTFLVHAWHIEEAPPEQLRTALDCLDLSALDMDARTTRGLTLVQQLETVLDTDPRGFDLSAVPHAWFDDRYELEVEAGRLTLVRSDAGWVIGAETIAALPALVDAAEALRRERPEPAASDAVVVAERSDPRATMWTFMKATAAKDWAAAAACLDLREIGTAVRGEEGQRLAGNLKYWIDHLERVVFQTLPDDPETTGPYVWKSTADGTIALHRLADGDARGQWMFTPATLAALGRAIKELDQTAPAAGVQTTGDAPLEVRIRQRIPDALEHVFGGIELWQWCGLLGLIACGLLADRAATWLTQLGVGQLLARGHIEVDRTTQRQSIRPIGLLAMAGLWWLGLRILYLETAVLGILLTGVKLFAAVAGVWTSYRLVDLLAGTLQARAQRTSNKFDDLIVPLVRKSCKVFVTIFGLVFIAQLMDWKISTLLAGLGISGLAIAFAARETLGNLFGSMTVLLDRPFQIGDWVKIGDSEGTVETVGFRSTRIRTFYDSMITIPNADCVNRAIDNMGGRRYRRFTATLGVEYGSTPDQLDAFCEGVRELIRRHPYTRKDTFHVYVNAFGASSIDIMLYCFLITPDWSTELRERHRLIVDILRLAQELGVGFSYPTQTVHLHRAARASGAPPIEDPRATGQRRAQDIVRATLGPHGHIPPPVSFGEVRPMAGDA